MTPKHLIVLDMETYYSRDFSLSKLTTEEYIRHPDFEVIGVSVKLDDEPAVWCTGDDFEIYTFLNSFPWHEAVAVAHNAMFDMAILNWKYQISPLALADTLSMARALHGSELSLSLKALASHYRLQAKGEEVVAAMGMRRSDFSTHGLKIYGNYCINDTEITRNLFDLLSAGYRVPFADDLKQLNRPGFPPKEMRLIDRTLRMFTEPKLELDRDVLVPHLQDVKDKKALLMAEIDAIRDDLMSNPKLAQLLIGLGVEPPVKISPTTGKETYAFSKSDSGFTDLLEHPDPKVQTLVAARLGVKSTLEETRTERFINMSARGPLAVPLKYYGAHTGRWSGSDKLNVQNIPRGSPLNQAIKAPPGFVLINSDSSQIEARTLAWLAGQHDLVAAFDRGEDVYKIMASSIYNKPVEDINKDERFLGKTVVLGAGYQIGWLKFQAQLKFKGVTVSDDVAQSIIYTYREQYPQIPLLWKEAGRALEAMLDNETSPLGTADALVVEGEKGIRLPSGLSIRYPDLRWEEKDGKREMVYTTKKGRSLIPTRIYGGKCLAGDTEVLTRRGWLPITEVRLSDEVWDGVEWVKHSGLIYQGEKVTTILDGVRMTPDHKVLTTEGWRDASSCEGLHRANFRMPDGCALRGGGKQWAEPQIPLAVSLPMWEHRGARSRKNRAVRTTWRDFLMRVCVGQEVQDPRHVKAPGVLGLAFHERPLPPAFASSLEKLRRAWGTGVSGVGSIVRNVLGGHGADLFAGAYVGAGRQQRKLHAAELPLGDLQRTSSKHQNSFTGRLAVGEGEDGRFTLDPRLPVAPEAVYDLRNAGPRTRFMVRGVSGPFVVHNCVENVCQALARIIIGDQLLMVARRYPVVLTVHDSIVAMAPEAEAQQAEEYVMGCMRIRPKWAATLPLNCEAKTGASYGG